MRRVTPLIISVFILGATACYGYYTHQRTPYPELQDLALHPRSFPELQTYFKNLAQQKGALYAYQILREAELPPQTDVHLLGHTVGDELYKQYGKDAISYCTNEFRNACSHSVVIGLLLEYGTSVLDDINESCKKAPGGIGAYTMCFHGLGHGVLAYEQYDLPKTIALCKKMGTAAYHNEEYGQCVGGAIMEGIAGGGHDRASWEKARPQYYTTQDPLSPCDQSYMPQEVRTFCYIYITPHLVEAAGGDMNHPDPSVFPKAFSFCRALPESDHNREVCMNGFGKEFVGWARQSDPRSITTLTDQEMELSSSWCALSGTAKDTRYCLQGIQSYVYWGGENDPRPSVRFCSLLYAQDPDSGSTCYEDLSRLIAKYVVDPDTRKATCALLPESVQHECMTFKQTWNGEPDVLH